MMSKPDNAAETAKDAYEIYRGMIQGGPVPPHWDELSKPHRGLLEWIIRFDRLMRS